MTRHPSMTAFNPTDQTTNHITSDSGQAMEELQELTPPHTVKQDDSDKGRPRSRSNDEDDEQEKIQVNYEPIGQGDPDPANSSNSDGGPARKRRRSRKGLDKKFECPHEGCGKSYSRAEHLYRHQLNHTPKQIYYCGVGDCTRSFVRQDLCNRHKDRHTAKGSSLSRKDRDNLDSHIQSPLAHPTNPAQSVPDPLSHETTRPAFASSKPPSTHITGHGSDGPFSQRPSPHLGTYVSAMRSGGTGPEFARQDLAYGAAASQNANMAYHTSPVAHARRQSDASPYGVLSPVSTQQGYHSYQTTPQTAVYSGTQNFPGFSLPPSSIAYGSPQVVKRDQNQGSPFVAPAAGEYPDQSAQQRGSEMMMLDQMAMPHTMPVFGSDSVYQKSPYASLPDDFMAFLFSSTSSQSSDSPHGRLAAMGGYNQYAEFVNRYNVTYEAPPMGFFPAQQVMSVTSLLDQALPESVISDEKSNELFDFIKERFHGSDSSPVDLQKETIVEGDRTQETHILSRKMMQAYIISYWANFSDQIPILHKPSFQPDKTPNLLLIAVMIIGAACLDKGHGPVVLAEAARLARFLAWDLRWALYRDLHNFGPPAKLWVFQALILLELYEKMYSTRLLHERAHIHHATTITLMRRGRALLGKSSLDSPPNAQNGSRHSPAGGASTADEWWDHWIINESTRRAAYAAFLVDSLHSTLFGHNIVMVAHEMRLPLPCDEKLWKATSGAEVGRIEANLQSSNIKPISFIEGIRRTLSNQPVQTNAFGRTVLMAGLLSVSWHMNQRDLQVSSLGNDVSQSLGGRDKWRATLIRSFDSWQADYDQAIKRGDIPSEIYLFETDRHHEANVVFESRTVLHHLAHIAMHVDIIDCQIFARAKRLLGRPIGAQDLISSSRRMKDIWAPKAQARDAVYYALQFLSSVLLPKKSAAPATPLSVGQQSSSSPGSFEEPYQPQLDVLMNRPWVLYISCLVVWSYGYAIEGACPEFTAAATKEGRVVQMREFLQTYGEVGSPENLKGKRGMNQSTALLMVCRDAFEMTRWELLHEGATLLTNCIQLNAGATL